MELEEIARHSVGSIIRDWKISLVSVIGVAFALAFVFGTMIAVDTIYAFSERQSMGTSLGHVDDVARVLSWRGQGEMEHKLLVAAMSLPAIAVGIIVSVVGANLAVGMRSEEVRKLRSQGASEGDISRILMMEAALLGVVATLAGLIFASFIGAAVLDAVLNFEFYTDADFSVGWRYLSISGGTLFLALVSGVGLMMLVSLGPSRRLLKQDESGDVRPPRRNRAAGLGPLLDVVLIALSLASIVDIFSGWKWEWSHGFDYYTGSLDAFFGALGLLLFPAMPFMLAVGVCGMLIRKPIAIHKRIGRRFAERGQIADSIEENPVDRKRSARACVLVALVLTFGTFASVTTQSMLEHDKAVSEFKVGADIYIGAGYFGYLNGSQWEPPLQFDDLEEIKGVPGVRSAAIIEHFVPRIDGEYVAGILIDPEDYLATVDPDDRFFDDRGSDELLEINTPGAALVNKMYAEEFDIGLDSRHTLHVVTAGATMDEVLDWYVNVTVVGFVDDLPGMISASMILGYETMSVIPSPNFEATSNGLAVLVDLGPGGDTEEVVSAADVIVQNAGYSGIYHMTLEGEYDQISGNSEYAGMSDLLAGEYVYLMLVVLTGLGLVFFVSIAQARTRSAGGNSAGPSNPHPQKLALGESVGVIFVGSAIGVGVALLTTYLFNMMWVPSGWEPVPRQVAFTLTSIAIIAVSVFSLFVVPFVSASLARRTKAQVGQQPRGWL